MGLNQARPVTDEWPRKVLPDKGWKIYDANAHTKSASKEKSLYWESLHFHCKVHNMLNVELVKLISSHHSNVTSSSKSSDIYSGSAVERI